MLDRFTIIFHLDKLGEIGYLCSPTEAFQLKSRWKHFLLGGQIPDYTHATGNYVGCNVRHGRCMGRGCIEPRKQKLQVKKWQSFVSLVRPIVTQWIACVTHMVNGCLMSTHSNRDAQDIPDCVVVSVHVGDVPTRLLTFACYIFRAYYMDKQTH